MKYIKFIGLLTLGFLFGFRAGMVHPTLRHIRVVVANAPAKDVENDVFVPGKRPFRVCTNVMYADILPVCQCETDWLESKN